MEKEYTLEEMRQLCSDYICYTQGIEFDTTRYWDKWQIFSMFRKIQGEQNEQVCNFRQNEQKTKT